MNMLVIERNNIQGGDWILEKLEEDDYSNVSGFDCSDNDLNEFFGSDALAHKKELITETYSLKKVTGEGNDIPVAFISFSNDAIRLSEEKKRTILPLEKQRYKSLPAVKIARLGVERKFQSKNIGTHLINMVKQFFLTDNRTGCRFVTVDAYNKERVLNFYKKNDFEFLYSKDEKKKTRIMYFDLKRLLT